MKRLAFLLICILTFNMFSLHPKAADSLIENNGFESDVLLWSRGSLSEITPYLGTKCFSLSAPVFNSDGTVVHSTTYQTPLQLQGGSVYSMRFYVRTDFSENTFLPDCQVFMPSDVNQIRFHVSNVSTSWKEVKIQFMVNASGAYTISFDAFANAQNSTIYLDEIQLTQIDFTPKTTCIQGRKNVTIPEAGTASYVYTPAVLDETFSTVTIRDCFIITEEKLPEGVSFNIETGTLFVNQTAEPETIITLFCVPYSDTSKPIASMKVLLSKNILQNGNFDDFPINSGWDTENSAFVPMQSTDDTFYAQVTPFTQSENGYTASMVPAQPIYLYANRLYVFRAKVRSDAPYITRYSYAEAFHSDFENKIHLAISEIGGTDWTDVLTSFRVPSDGIYTLSLDFLTPDGRPIYIDSVKISQEEVAPSVIQLDLPLHIAIPENESLQYPIAHAVLTQENELCEEAVSFSVSPENQGVKIENQVLYVSPSTATQTYTVRAFLTSDPNVQVERKITITDTSVGDGSFEYPTPGAYWTTASPSALHFVSAYNGFYPSGGSLFARLSMNGAVSVVMSDSVFQYNKNSSYVFEADIRKIVPDIETVITVLVDNVHSASFDDNLVIGQYILTNNAERMQILFTPSESVTGRIMIAFNTPENHDQQIILMDDISVSSAKVYASSVRISGLPYLDKDVSGKYRFTSNFNAIDASTYRWLISDTEDGIYMPIANETDNALSITAEMQNKYLKFEVTPISLSGPVVGDSVSSLPIRVGEPIPTDNEVVAPMPDEEPLPPAPIAPEKPTLSTQGMNVLDIRNYVPMQKQHFFDLENHWAKNEIELLTAANVLEGRGNGLFEPEESITRAEFSAILARAFELAPIYYEGQFSDVKKHDWYAGAIAVVTKYGFANGTSDSLFSPNLPITREEMASMIMRAYRKTNAVLKTSSHSFTDASEISTWATMDISDSCALGILSGLPDGKFYPKKNATRAEAAAAIKRMLTTIAEQLGTN